MSIKKYCFGLAFILLFSGCAVKKPSIKTVETGKEVSRANKKLLLAQLEGNRITYSSFSGKAKTKLDINKSSYNASLNLRVKHQEAIWISVTAILGIEVARVLITPNRIQIMNRLQNEYIDKPFDFLYQFTSQEFTFNEIEDLLIGNVMSFALNPNVTAFGASSGFELQGKNMDLDFSMLISQDFQLTNAKFSQANIQQKLISNYGDYHEVSEQQIPRSIQILIDAPKLALDAVMNYNNVTLNTALELPFQVPTSYKQLD